MCSIRIQQLEGKPMSKIKITIVCLIVICTAANVMAGCYETVVKNCGCGATKRSRKSVACSNIAHMKLGGTGHGNVSGGSYTCSICKKLKRRAKIKDFEKAVGKLMDTLSNITTQ